MKGFDEKATQFLKIYMVGLNTICATIPDNKSILSAFILYKAFTTPLIFFHFTDSMLK